MARRPVPRRKNNLLYLGYDVEQNPTGVGRTEGILGGGEFTPRVGAPGTMDPYKPEDLFSELTPQEIQEVIAEVAEETGKDPNAVAEIAEEEQWMSQGGYQEEIYKQQDFLNRHKPYLTDENFGPADGGGSEPGSWFNSEIPGFTGSPDHPNGATGEQMDAIRSMTGADYTTYRSGILPTNRDPVRGDPRGNTNYGTTKDRETYGQFQGFQDYPNSRVGETTRMKEQETYAPNIRPENISNFDVTFPDKDTTSRLRPSTAQESSSPRGSGVMASALGVSDSDVDLYKSALAGFESGNRYNIMGGSDKAVSGGRFAGKYQMGGEEIANAAKRAGIDPNSVTRVVKDQRGNGKNVRVANDNFLSNPALQEQLFEHYTVSNHETLAKNSSKHRNAKGDELLANLSIAHSAGPGGAASYLSGKTNPKDANGVAAKTYADRFHKARAEATSRGVPAGQSSDHFVQTPEDLTGAYPPVDDSSYFGDLSSYQPEANVSREPVSVGADTAPFVEPKPVSTVRIAPDGSIITGDEPAAAPIETINPSEDPSYGGGQQHPGLFSLDTTADVRPVKTESLGLSPEAAAVNTVEWTPDMKREGLPQGSGGVLLEQPGQPYRVDALTGGSGTERSTLGQNMINNTGNSHLGNSDLAPGMKLGSAHDHLGHDYSLPRPNQMVGTGAGILQPVDNVGWPGSNYESESGAGEVNNSGWGGGPVTSTPDRTGSFTGSPSYGSATGAQMDAIRSTTGSDYTAPKSTGRVSQAPDRTPTSLNEIREYSNAVPHTPVPAGMAEAYSRGGPTRPATVRDPGPYPVGNTPPPPPVVKPTPPVIKAIPTVNESDSGGSSGPKASSVGGIFNSNPIVQAARAETAAQGRNYRTQGVAKPNTVDFNPLKSAANIGSGILTGGIGAAINQIGGRLFGGSGSATDQLIGDTGNMSVPVPSFGGSNYVHDGGLPNLSNAVIKSHPYEVAAGGDQASAAISPTSGNMVAYDPQTGAYSVSSKNSDGTYSTTIQEGTHRGNGGRQSGGDAFSRAIDSAFGYERR